MPTIPPVPLGQDPKDLIPKTFSGEEGDWSLFYVDFISRQTHVNKYFKAPNMKEAIKMAQNYCNATRTKYVRTWPFICDLEAETKAAIASSSVVNENHFYQLNHVTTPSK